MEKQIKTPATYFTVSALTELIVLIGVIFLMLGNPITVITGTKLHYFIFLVLSFFIFIINISSYINIEKAIYFLLLFASVVFFLIHNSINLPFIYSLLTYVIIPFIFFNRNFKYFDFTVIMKAFEIFTFLNFIGVLLQVIGFESAFLAVDMVWTEGELHQRYGSIAGGTLALGFTASISSIYTFFLIIYKKQNSLYNFFVLSFSILTLLLAQSRRYYFLVFIIMIITYVFDVNTTYSLKKIISIALGSFILIITTFYLGYLLKDRVYFFQRAFSIFNFEDDAANVIRVAKWLETISTFLKNAWFGIGIGGTGTIGKNFTEDSSLDDIITAESFYLKVFVECGIFFGIFLLSLFVITLKRSFKALRKHDTALAAIFFIFFFMECFMSTGLEAPIASILFWICLSQIVFYPAYKISDL